MTTHEKHIPIESTKPGELGRTLEIRQVDGDKDHVRVVIVDAQGNRHPFVGLTGDLKLAIAETFDWFPVGK